MSTVYELQADGVLQSFGLFRSVTSAQRAADRKLLEWLRDSHRLWSKDQEYYFLTTRLDWTSDPLVIPASVIRRRKQNPMSKKNVFIAQYCQYGWFTIYERQVRP